MLVKVTHPLNSDRPIYAEVESLEAAFIEFGVRSKIEPCPKYTVIFDGRSEVRSGGITTEEEMLNPPNEPTDELTGAEFKAANGRCGRDW